MICSSPKLVYLKNNCSIRVPCGHCINCRIQKSSDWATRICLELPFWDSNIFTTLTYDDDHIPSDWSIHKDDLQKFFKRLRREIEYNAKSNGLEVPKIAYFASGEYGDKSMRPHYHAIIFGVGLDLNNYNNELQCYYSDCKLIENNWSYGNVYNGCVSYDSARYTADYVLKQYSGELKQKVYTDNGLETPFCIHSNGIGKRFVEVYESDIIGKGYIIIRGVKKALPRYFYDILNKKYRWHKCEYDDDGKMIFGFSYFENFQKHMKNYKGEYLEADQMELFRRWRDECKELYDCDVSFDDFLQKEKCDFSDKIEQNVARNKLNEHKKIIDAQRSLI
ncbi:replication initiator protein [Capybara microvirus Cap1_SP_161]|nr:replication initiator protein [Capybara microvirus Cap1_SP_161]